MTEIISGEGSCEISNYGLPITDTQSKRRNFPGYADHGAIMPKEFPWGGNTEDYARNLRSGE
jgi:hypothetical protein